jgi:hypothetical protein
MGRPVPATEATHGPFKKVARIVDETVHEAAVHDKPWGRARDVRRVYEVLECGHQGKFLFVGDYTPHAWQLDVIETTREKAERGKARRRCYECREPHCDWCGQKQTADRPLTDRLPIYGANDGVHAECLVAHEDERRRAEEWTARVREENLARRRAAGEDV